MTRKTKIELIVIAAIMIVVFLISFIGKFVGPSDPNKVIDDLADEGGQEESPLSDNYDDIVANPEIAPNVYMEDDIDSYSPDISSKKGNTTGNIGNMGIASFNGSAGVVKVHDGYDSSLHLIDGEHKERISTDNAFYVNIVEEGIFFVNMTDGGRIYKVDYDGTESVMKDTEAGQMYIEDGWIYYIEPDAGFKLSRMKLDGTDNETIVESGAIKYIVDSNTLYYVDSNDGLKLYEMNIDSKEKTVIVEDNTWNPILHKEGIYYIKSETLSGPLYKYSLQDKEEKKVVAENVESFVLDGNVLYYCLVEGGFYEYLMDEDVVNKISDDKFFSMQVWNSKVVMLNSDRSKTMVLENDNVAELDLDIE